MNHFLQISDLSSQHVEWLLHRANQFKKGQARPTSLSNQHLVNLFYENSTRTRVSFELAAKHLGVSVINFQLENSSESKGEIIEDTIKNLAAMGINLFVIRHSEGNLPFLLAQTFSSQPHVHLINAGNGTHEHPSQAMLDLMTILEEKPAIQPLKIAIVGDIAHSRVANSLQSLFSLVGIEELRLIGPEIWLPKTPCFGKIISSLEEGLANVDVIICLRVQRERLAAHETMDLQTYRAEYAITPSTIKHAKSDAMILHPGPVNRDVEIDSCIVESAQSFILRQVTNGVFMRMAIIDGLLSSFLQGR